MNSKTSSRTLNLGSKIFISLSRTWLIYNIYSFIHRRQVWDVLAYSELGINYIPSSSELSLNTQTFTQVSGVGCWLIQILFTKPSHTCRQGMDVGQCQLRHGMLIYPDYLYQTFTIGIRRGMLIYSDSIWPNPHICVRRGIGSSRLFWTKPWQVSGVGLDVLAYPSLFTKPSHRCQVW